MRNRVLLIFLASLLLFIGSCTCRREPKIPLGSIDVEIIVKRFDKDIFSINVDNIEAGVARLEEIYPKFFPLFTEGIIGIGLPDGPEFNE